MANMTTNPKCRWMYGCTNSLYRGPDGKSENVWLCKHHWELHLKQLTSTPARTVSSFHSTTVDHIHSMPMSRRRRPQTIADIESNNRAPYQPKVQEFPPGNESPPCPPAPRHASKPKAPKVKPDVSAQKEPGFFLSCTSKSNTPSALPNKVQGYVSVLALNWKGLELYSGHSPVPVVQGSSRAIESVEG
ncbi:hypothetical protein B0T20DRAFT_391273 [Sordaria brevicollis]|uniref:Uncharacterized protein n=1 Tax=Sordaria brevicollis TaxID=83679 RepID=A0AAE0PH69_SORBR|nr:hypothetical protein B0T20DRAFT_391273 [Sordaria brevicollis]